MVQTLIPTLLQVQEVFLEPILTGPLEGIPPMMDGATVMVEQPIYLPVEVSVMIHNRIVILQRNTVSNEVQ